MPQRSFLLLVASTIVIVAVTVSKLLRPGDVVGSVGPRHPASANAADTDAQECKEALGTCGGDDGPEGRLVTRDELSLHTTVENRIWLSILGKVYDVTEGADYYGPGSGGYHFYAGRDASPCFSTGTNTEEGANEKIEEWEDKKLMGVYEWSTFYADHETYKYVGVLAGSRYYDESGNEMPMRKDIVTRSKEAKRVMDEERERKKRERLAARKKKKK